MGILRTAFLWASHNKWLEHQMRQRRFARRAVSRFMPGEDLDSALDEARKLSERNVRTSLSCLGENVTSLSDAEEITRHYEAALERAHEHGLSPHLSLKPTHLGMDQDAEATYRNLDSVVRRARSHGSVVWVDMESSEYVDATIALYERARTNHENVGICIQSYLRRTADDLTRLLGIGARIRLVKGAYDEPATVAFRRKRDVDANFYALAQQLLRHVREASGAPPGIATHDVGLIERVRSHAQQMGLGDDAFEVQMLYGIRRAEQFRLAERGIPVRVLISYGDAWFPWYMRRLAERPANVGFVLRSMIAR